MPSGGLDQQEDPRMWLPARNSRRPLGPAHSLLTVLISSLKSPHQPGTDRWSIALRQGTTISGPWGEPDTVRCGELKPQHPGVFPQPLILCQPSYPWTPSIFK